AQRVLKYVIFRHQIAQRIYVSRVDALDEFHRDLERLRISVHEVSRSWARSKLTIDLKCSTHPNHLSRATVLRCAEERFGRAQLTSPIPVERLYSPTKCPQNKAKS